jgi:hypothetical protein
LIGESDSLAEVIRMAYWSNEDGAEGYTAAHIDTDADDHYIMMRDIPLAFMACTAFKTRTREYSEAGDKLTKAELAARMDAYQYGFMDYTPMINLVSTAEIMKRFGVNRQRVAAIAKGRGWRSITAGQNRGHLYRAADVEAEAERRIAAGLKA